MKKMVPVLISLLISPTVLADGVLEINQACALNGGCFPGDAAGFPVLIDGSAGKSYRLTSDLNLSSSPGLDAIEIDSPYVTLDLNGFEIAGPVTCTGSGASINCGTPGSASGIQVNNGSQGVLIRNGTIRNMDSHGLSSSAGRLTLNQLRAYNNARDGFRASQPGSIVTECVAEQNAGDGFDFGVTSVIERSTAHGNGGNGFLIEFQKGVIRGSTARFNGARGFQMGPSGRFKDNTSDLNEDPDRCSGGVCTDRRRYYMTASPSFDGSQATGACASGFHMASLYELHDVSHMQYDTVLGYTLEDTGSGPPFDPPGWVRSGSSGSSLNLHCDVWSRTSGTGAILNLRGLTQWSDPAETGSPWNVQFANCVGPRRVWCIED